MYRSQYESTMADLLSDKSTYIAVMVNPLNDLMKQNNSFVKQLFDLDVIDSVTKSKFICSGSNVQRIFGLFKAHEDGIPLRPVVDNTNSSAYHLFKYTNDILVDTSNSSAYHFFKYTYQ